MDHEDRTQSLSTFVAGLALGAVIGAGAALLTAPRNGRGTRRRLRRAADGVRHTTTERFDEIADEFRDRVDQAVDGARRRLRR